MSNFIFKLNQPPSNDFYLKQNDVVEKAPMHLSSEYNEFDEFYISGILLYFWRY